MFFSEKAGQGNQPGAAPGRCFCEQKRRAVHLGPFGVPGQALYTEAPHQGCRSAGGIAAKMYLPRVLFDVSKHVHMYYANF